MEHGTLNRYQSRGCRCLLCRAANAQYHAERRAIRYSTRLMIGGRLVAPHPLFGGPQHGRRGTYVNWGCQCEPCTHANTEYQNAR